MDEVTLAGHLEQFHLDPGFWESKLSEYGINKVGQLKYVDTETAFGLLTQIRYSWEAKALKDCFSIEDTIWTDYLELKKHLDTIGSDTKQLLKNLHEQNIHSVAAFKGLNADKLDELKSQVTQDKDSLKRCIRLPEEKCLDAHLEKFGLDATFWKQHLQQVKINALSQLDQIDEKSCDVILKCAKRYKKIEKWEEKRLRKCLGLPEKTYETPDLKDAKDDVKKCKDELEKSHAKHLEVLKTKMEKDENWEKLQTETKQQALDKVKEPVALGIPVLTRDSDTDVNLVQNISAGLILKGYFLSKNKQESIECKETLLKSPETVHISLPSMPEQSLEDEYFSKEEADAFQHVLQHGGHSMAASVKGGGWGFKAEASGGYKSESTTETKNIRQKSRTYVNKTRYCFVPTKSCSLSQDDYHLSAHALKALTEIETLLENDKYIFNRRCEAFFDKFGSHYYNGTYHFGGIYQWSATYESNETFDKSEALKMCQRAIQTSVSLGYKGIICSVSGNVSTSDTSGEASSEKEKVSTEMSNIKTLMSKFGGPQEADSITDWKSGLVSNTSTWTVIDRGDLSAKNYSGVWKLIQNDRSRFKNPIALSLAVKEAWESVTNMCDDTDDFSYIDLLDDAMKDLENEKTYESEEVTSHLLRSIDKITEKLNAKFESNDIWVKKVKEQSEVRKHLEQLRNESKSNDICFYAVKLLSRLTHFSQQLDGIDQLTDKLTVAYTQFNSTDINDRYEMDKLRIKVTEDISEAFYRFQQDDLLQFIFFTTSLNTQGFDFLNMVFKHSLSENSVKDIRTGVTECFVDFQNFCTIAKGIVDTNRCIECLRRLVDSLEAISECPKFHCICRDYLSEEPRVQDFLEVAVKHISSVKDDKKELLRKLLLRLLHREKGNSIRLQRADLLALLQEGKESLDPHCIGTVTKKNKIKIRLVKGDIGKQKGDILVCCTSTSLKLDSGAAANLVHHGGSQLKDECSKTYPFGIEKGKLAVINGGRLKCDKVILTALPEWTEGEGNGRKILKDFLREVYAYSEKYQKRSIVFSAMGTGRYLSYPKHVVAKAMYDSVFEFDDRQRRCWLREVTFCVHWSDEGVIKAFEKEEQARMRPKSADGACATEFRQDVGLENASVKIVIGELHEEKVDAIICSVSSTMNLSSSMVGRTLLKHGGDELQRECSSRHGNLPVGDVVDIEGGRLLCNTVLLANLPEYTRTDSAKTLKSVLHTAFKAADDKGYQSLAIPAIGTGQLNYPPEVVAGSMYDAVQEWDADNPSTKLHDFRFVLYDKNKDVIEAFRTCEANLLSGAMTSSRSMKYGRSRRRPLNAFDAYKAFFKYSGR